MCVCWNNCCAELTSSAGKATVVRAGSGSPGGAAVKAGVTYICPQHWYPEICKWEEKGHLTQLDVQKMDRCHWCYGVGILPPLKTQIFLPPFFAEERQDWHYNIRGIIQLLEHFIFNHFYGELLSYFSFSICFNTWKSWQTHSYPHVHSGRIGKHYKVYLLYQKVEAKTEWLTWSQSVVLGQGPNLCRPFVVFP